MGNIWLVFLLFILIVVEAAMVAIFLRQSQNFYKELAEESQVRLWPPSIRLLAFLPVLGKRWLRRIREATREPIKLVPPDERAFAQDLQISGEVGAYLLLEEQHNLASGENDGVRFYIINNKTAYEFISQPESGGPHEANEIEVQTARPLHKRIIWGYLKFSGGDWVVENVAANGEIFPVLSPSFNRYILKSYIKNTRALPLNSGDRFLIGISDFCLIDLSNLDSNLKGYEELIDIDTKETHGKYKK